MENLGIIFISLLSYIIPKKSGYWVCTSFLHRGKYSGDPKYLFEYIHNSHNSLPNSIKLVYAARNEETENKIKNLGYPVVRNKINWFFALLRAEIIIIDGIRYGLGLGRFRFVQLWHGVGYKNIVLLNKNNTSNPIKTLLLKQFLRKIKIITATSNAEKIRRQKAFDNSKVAVTGSPRVDFFINLEKDETWQKTILYAPTYRREGQSQPFNEKNWTTLNKLMIDLEVVFLVKKHPNDKNLIVPNNFSHIKDVTDITEDIQSLLTRTSLLITDYSSIATDFACLNRPIIFFTYDFEQYLKTNRTFYYNLKEVLPGPFAQDYGILESLLKDWRWFGEEEYQKKYLTFKNRFHQFDDGKSGTRILNEIINYTKLGNDSLI